jgi:putative nucleotidyltransferase with HDIG domain
MPTSKLTTRLFWGFEALVIAGTVTAAAVLSRAADWQPLALVGLLLALSLVGHRLIVRIGGGIMTAAHIALVLSMTLLGPTPAVAFGIAAAVLSSATRRLPAPLWLSNLFTFSLFPFAGGLMARGLAGNIHLASDQHVARGVGFAFVVFAVFLVTVALNFATVALDVRVDEGRSLLRQAREAFIPLLPGHLAAGVLAAILAVAFTNLGLPVLLGAVLVLGIFHYLTTALMRSEDRADQLEARSIQLASLQFGVLATLMDALAFRDRTTARHAANVARHAKRLAVEIGCDEEDQEVVHTAALLHDIGKFTLPDRILHSQLLSDEDWSLIRRHPQDGATLVGKLDGYGAVADAILYHHEQVDGGGYPAGLIGKEIPLASRIVAICSTYDTLTARESYRATMTPQDAMTELRRVAGRQLDAELVEAFVAMLERDGPAALAQDEEADFGVELDFEKRVRKMATPSAS